MVMHWSGCHPIKQVRVLHVKGRAKDTMSEVHLIYGVLGLLADNCTTPLIARAKRSEEREPEQKVDPRQRCLLLLQARDGTIKIPFACMQLATKTNY